MSSDGDNKPWYKQLWPWLIITPPLAAVLGGIATIVIAVKNQDSLVIEKTRKLGKVVTTATQLHENATQMQIIAHLFIQPKTGTVAVELEGDQQSSQLLLQIAHPTLEEEDRHCSMIQEQDKIFRCQIEPLTAKRWKLRLASDETNWALSGHYNGQDARVILSASSQSQ